MKIKYLEKRSDEQDVLLSPLLVPVLANDVTQQFKATVGEEPDTPLIDKKKYRVIRLPNQLTALLISQGDVVQNEAKKRLSVLMEQPAFKQQKQLDSSPPLWASRDQIDTSHSSSISSFIDEYGSFGEKTIRVPQLGTLNSGMLLSDSDLNSFAETEETYPTTLGNVLGVASSEHKNGNNQGQSYGCYTYDDEEDERLGDGFGSQMDMSRGAFAIDGISSPPTARGQSREGWIAGGDSGNEWSSSEESDDNQFKQDEVSLQESSESGLDDNQDAFEEERYHHKAAVALSVGVGSYCDPVEIPGLAHFLEHMLYMGTETYRTENALDSYVHRHGGDCNASTDMEQTMFQFNVQDGFLEKALAIFSRFFKEPLLMEDAIVREAAAIDAEFELSRYDDSCRRNEVLLQLANENSPVKGFTWGSYQTLINEPKKKNIDVRASLWDLCNKYYRPNLMKLTMVSCDSLDTMQAMVEAHFSDLVPTANERPDLIKMAGGDGNRHAAFSKERFHKLVKVVPVKRRRLLELTFALPSLDHKYKAKPAAYVCELLGHEGPGSILSHLKKKSLALALSVGNGGTGYERNSAGYLLKMSIELTANGEKCIDEVIAVVFEYIRMLKAKGIQRWIFDEQQAIYNMAFQFAEEIAPIQLVESLAYDMQYYPDKDILTGNTLASEFDPEWIMKVLDFMDPNEVCVCITSMSFASLDGLQEEPRFGTQYIIEDIPTEWIAKWHVDVCKGGNVLKLPLHNHFLATDFEIRPKPNTEQRKSDEKLYFACLITDLILPSMIYEGDRGKLWFKQDEHFKLPRAYVYFSLTSPCMYRSPRTVMIMYMYILLLTYNAKEYGYAAEAAQLSYAFNLAEQGITLQLAGFNHKVPVLIDHLTSTMKNFATTEAAFNDTRDLLMQELHNDLLKPDRTCQESRLCILQRVKWSIRDKIEALERLTVEDVTHFLPEFQNTVHVQAYMHGNMTKEEALGLFHNVTKQLNTDGGIPTQLFPMERTVVIEPGTWVYRIPNNNPTDDNSSVENYYQIGPETLRGRVVLELLEMILFEPCFDYLRTKKQLGYDVGCEYRNTHGILGFSVHVSSRSRKFTVEHVAEAMEQFLVYAAELIRTLDENDFQEMVDALQAENLRPDIGLQGEIDRNWDELLQHSDLFDRYLIEAEVLRTVTKAELLEWMVRYILPSPKRRQLCIQVYGKSESEVSTDDTLRVSLEGIEMHQINDIHNFKRLSYLYPHLSAAGI